MKKQRTSTLGAHTKSSLLCLLFVVGLSKLLGQTAPAHLKYFGYALVDMGWDDPHDSSTTTNYIMEVDSFSNIAQMGVYGPTDNIVSRTLLMTSRCVKPILSVQSIFYLETDHNAPSGHHFKLYPNFVERWQYFVKTNASVLHASHIASFYVADEPLWNGIDYQDLDTVCQTIKKDFPDIPIMFIEAYAALGTLKIPRAADWVGFDRYALFDPSTNSEYLNDLNILKSRRSTASQRVFLVADTQWLPSYGLAGYAPDTLRYVIENYYKLAASDTSILGMIGYLWAGGLDAPEQLGVRDMPQSVIDKNIAIGSLIKANAPLCLTTNTYDAGPPSPVGFSIYPNPATASLQITTGGYNLQDIEIYNNLGYRIKVGSVAQEQTLDISDLPTGIYLIRAKGAPQSAQRFTKQ